MRLKSLSKVNNKLLKVLLGCLVVTVTLAASLRTPSDEWNKTDFTKKAVDLSEIMSGGPPKDGIPAIDDPSFVSQNAASKWLGNREPVIVLEINGRARAYPLQILIYHEIVNDSFEGIPVSVTFCPLCNASIVYKRELDGKILDFGTTGKLRKSDMVMYDRQTESWWQQFTGIGIVGFYTGKQLAELPATIVAFEGFRKNFPSGKVLSRATGYMRPYGKNPYRGYDSIDQTPFLYFDPLDPRLPPMERVLGVKFEAQNKVYPFSELEKNALINDAFNDQAVVIMSEFGMVSPLDKSLIKDSRYIRSAKAYDRKLGDQLLSFVVKGSEFYDEQTGSQWNIFGKSLRGPLKGKQLKHVDSGVHFAFAWMAFRPNSLIYRSAKLP